MSIKQSVKIRPYHNEGERLRKLSEIELSNKEKEVLSEHLLDDLKPIIISIVKMAFYKYCDAHKASPEVSNLEWHRFKKILTKVL